MEGISVPEDCELLFRLAFGNIKVITSVELGMTDFVVVFKEEHLPQAGDDVSLASDSDNDKKAEISGQGDFPDQGEVFGSVDRVEAISPTKRTSVRCKELHSKEEEEKKMEG